MIAQHVSLSFKFFLNVTTILKTSPHTAVSSHQMLKYYVAGTQNVCISGVDTPEWREVKF